MWYDSSIKNEKDFKKMNNTFRDIFHIVIFSLFMFGLFAVMGKLDIDSKYCDYSSNAFYGNKCNIATEFGAK